MTGRSARPTLSPSRQGKQPARLAGGEENTSIPTAADTDSKVAAQTDSGASHARLEADLMALIASDGLRAGDRLPTERALAERFGVTRGAVRSALGRIEGRGYIVRIVGSGTYIADAGAPASDTPSAAPAAPNPGVPAIRPARDASPREIMEARRLIEPQLPDLVVAHANGADLDQILLALESAEAAPTLEEFEAWDGRFHQAIANATHNSLVIEIYQIVTAARNLAEWGELKRRNATEQRRAEREAEHRAIYNRLLARDAEGAQRAFERHLHKVTRNLAE